MFNICDPISNVAHPDNSSASWGCDTLRLGTLLLMKKRVRNGFLILEDHALKNIMTTTTQKIHNVDDHDPKGFHCSLDFLTIHHYTTVPTNMPMNES